MQMDFQQQKARQLRRKDRSNEGKWDKAIISLCNKINKKREYYTTSSCAGRITLVKGLREKARNVFLFKTHEKIKFIQLKKELEKIRKKERGLIYFKQEPCILHVACQDFEAGLNLLRKAREAGWKRSGIISQDKKRKRVMLELMSTEKMELPIINKGEVLVSEEYLKLLVKEANKKLERVRGKIKKFENIFK